MTYNPKTIKTPLLPQESTAYFNNNGLMNHLVALADSRQSLHMSIVVSLSDAIHFYRKSEPRNNSADGEMIAKFLIDVETRFNKEGITLDVNNSPHFGVYVGVEYSTCVYLYATLDHSMPDIIREKLVSDIKDIATKYDCDECWEAGNNPTFILKIRCWWD